MVKKFVIAVLGLAVAAGLGLFIAVRVLLDPEQVRATIERQVSAAVGEPVRIGRAELALWPRAGVTLSEVRIGEPAAVTLARTEVSTSLRALLSRRIEDAEVVVRDSTLDLPRVLATLDRLGRPVTETSAARDASPDGSGVTVVSVRRIALDNVRIAAGGRTALVGLRSSLVGDRLEIENATVRADDTTLTATGTIDSLARRQGRLTVAAEALDLDGLIAFAQDFSTQVQTAAQAAPAGAAPLPYDLVLELVAASGRTAGAAFSDLVATARLTPDGLRFDPFALQVFGGRLTGTLAVNLAGTEPVLTLSGTMAGADMVQLTAYAGQSGSITGSLDGTLIVTATGADPARAMATARGEGQVTVSQGTMRGLQLVRPIVLAFGRPDAAQPVEGGEAFSSMSMRFVLANGVATMSELAFDSRDVELRGAGTLALAGSRLDVRADARLSEALTQQAGRDLVRFTAQGGRVTIPATVTGTVDAPSVGVSVGNLAQRAVTNELKRQTESAIRGLLNRKKK